MSKDHSPTRVIAREAVRGELARTAFALFAEHGYEAVRMDDVAAAAGVSRSTVHRAFGSKEALALGVLDTHGTEVADALAARPEDEDVWQSLRRSLDLVVERSHANRAGALAMARLVQRTPALWARQHERQHAWAGLLARVLLERSPQAGAAAGVWAMAAMGCLGVAVDLWSAADGRPDLAVVLDDAFAALEARLPATGHSPLSPGA